jgi:hypothetical protein
MKHEITLQTIENMILIPTSSISMEYIVAILNSDFFTFYMNDFIFMHCHLSTSLDSAYLVSIPIPIPTEEQHKRIIDLIRIIENNVQENLSQNLLPAQIEKNKDYQSINERINQEIFQLFQITPKEMEYIQCQLKLFF